MQKLLSSNLCSMCQGLPLIQHVINKYTLQCTFAVCLQILNTHTEVDDWTAGGSNLSSTDIGWPTHTTKSPVYTSPTTLLLVVTHNDMNNHNNKQTFRVICVQEVICAQNSGAFSGQWTSLLEQILTALTIAVVTTTSTSIIYQP